MPALLTGPYVETRDIASRFEPGFDPQFNYDPTDPSYQRLHAMTAIASPADVQAVEFSVRVPPPPAAPGKASITGFRLEPIRQRCRETKVFAEAVKMLRACGTESRLFVEAEFYAGDVVGSYCYHAEYDSKSESWSEWRAN